MGPDKGNSIEMAGSIIADLKWLRIGKIYSWDPNSMSFWTKLGYFWKMEGQKMRDLKWPLGATSYISRNLAIMLFKID